MVLVVFSQNGTHCILIKKVLFSNCHVMVLVVSVVLVVSSVKNKLPPS